VQSLTIFPLKPNSRVLITGMGALTALGNPVAGMRESMKQARES
jgi:hypothetical protein